MIFSFSHGFPMLFHRSDRWFQLWQASPEAASKPRALQLVQIDLEQNKAKKGCWIIWYHISYIVHIRRHHHPGIYIYIYTKNHIYVSIYVLQACDWIWSPSSFMAQGILPWVQLFFEGARATVTSLVGGVPYIAISPVLLQPSWLLASGHHLIPVVHLDPT